MYQVSRLGVCEILFNMINIREQQLKQVNDLIPEGRYFEEFEEKHNLITLKFRLSDEAQERYTNKTIDGRDQCENTDKAINYVTAMNEEIAEGFYIDIKDRLLDIGIKEHQYSLRVY